MPSDASAPPRRLDVRAITDAEHSAFLETPSAATRAAPASFLQTPGWGRVKLAVDWSASSLGWFDEQDRLVGVALVLFRAIPRQRRWSLAYLPEGPVVDWADDDLDVWLEPMVAHLRRRHCFGIRMGPMVVTSRWDAAAVKAGLADDDAVRLTDLPPTGRPPVGAAVVSALRERGWRSLAVLDGFGAGQPQFNFAIPLLDDDGASREDAALLAGMNQQWRRNIKKADKAGVEVTHVVPDGTPGAYAEQVAAFHRLYVETAERDGFGPRPLSYFQSMSEAMGADGEDRIRFWAVHHEGDHVAGSISLRVGRRVWYAYGASSSDKRDVRASNAMQWAMIRHARDVGAAAYDLRGITATVSDDDSHAGLIRFKVGTGGEALRYAGEWDLPLNPLLYRAFDLYMSRR